MKARHLAVGLAALALLTAACSSDTTDDAGPSVTAEATAEGTTITVTMSATGVDIVEEPPSEEHFHVFLDVEPALDGTAIPTEDPAIIHTRATTATFENVEAGEHTITVVVGDAEHVPLDPPVTATTTVTVEG